MQGKTKTAPLLEERCLCGSLLAKVSVEGVEILCRRCKRIHVIPWLGEGRESSAPQKSTTAVDR